jgi:Fic family protein
MDVAVLTALGEARGRQVLYAHQRPEVLESLKRVAVVESAESSNRLEGITAPRERIEALVLRPTRPRDRSEQEIAGYRDGLALIHESHERLPFSVNVVLQLHGLLYRYHQTSGGQFKATDNDIVEVDAEGRMVRVRFRPTSAADTPAAMDALGAGYRAAAERNDATALVLVPLAILDLLCIHPFMDGNGRAARLVTLLLLYHHGYEVGRYVSLERIVEESSQTYYETLEKSSQGWHEGRHDARPWLSYFWGALLRAYREFEQRVGVLSAPAGKSEQVRAAVLRRRSAFAISDIERDCPNVSRELVRLVLRALRDDGVIAVSGRGRGAKWRRTEL